MASQDDVEKELNYAFTREHKNSKKMLVRIIVVVAVAALCLLAYLGYLPAISLSDGSTSYISESDAGFQQSVKNATGYDWSNLPTSEIGGKAVLLLLAGEIRSLDGDYAFVQRSTTLQKSEFGIARVDANATGKVALSQIVLGMQRVESVFLSKGLESTGTRLDRLSKISNWLKSNSLPEGTLSNGEKKLFAQSLGLEVENYDRVIALITVNYDLFVS